MKTRKGKNYRGGEREREREEFHYNDGDYKWTSLVTRVSGFQWSPSFTLGGISYLYRSYQQDKVRESRLILILKFLILIAIELNVMVWIEIGESSSLSGSPCLAVIRTNCPWRVTALFGWCLGLKIEISFNQFISFSNYSTRLKFKLDRDSGSDVLKVATCRASFGGRIDMRHNLRRVRKWPLHLGFPGPMEDLNTWMNKFPSWKLNKPCLTTILLAILYICRWACEIMIELYNYVPALVEMVKDLPSILEADSDLAICLCLI